MFYLDSANDLAVAQIPKAGLTSLREWAGNNVVANSCKELGEITHRVAFIRDPIDRLQSAYWMFKELESLGTPHSSGTDVSRWESFVDQVLDETLADNEHWLPQSEHCGGVPNEIHRFENISAVCKRFKSDHVPHKNKSNRLGEVNVTYRISEIKAKYADDYKLRGAS